MDLVLSATVPCKMLECYENNLNYSHCFDSCKDAFLGFCYYKLEGTAYTFHSHYDSKDMIIDPFPVFMKNLQYAKDILQLGRIIGSYKLFIRTIQNNNLNTD